MSARSGREAAWAIGLALGAGRPPTLEWDLLWTIARRERLAMLAWLRSGETIRRFAPPGVTAQWRRHAIAAQTYVEAQQADLVAAADALADAGVEAIVLKGLPLSARLYGTPAARLSTDIDLFVPAESRSLAATTLQSIGWSLRQGRAPLDQTFERMRGGRLVFLEVHSTLVHETLAHVRLEPALLEDITVGDRTFRSLDSTTLAVYLAAHAAIHDHPSLLWFADLATLWRHMPEEARQASLCVASRARLARHLAWALRRAEAIERAPFEVAPALRRLGFQPDGERRDHPFVRALALAATPVDALHVLSAWAWPRFVRGDRTATIAMMKRRLARLLPAAAPARDGGAATSEVAERADLDVAAGSRSVRLDRQDFLAMLDATVVARGHVWVRVKGASMSPAVPPDALVRLGPLPARSLRKGDVVLALLPGGLPVLHRVQRVDGDALLLRGDALPYADAPVTVQSVLAHADRLRSSGVERPMPPRGRLPWRRIGAHWYRRVLSLTSVT